jgi:hypothetical protein
MGKLIIRTAIVIILGSVLLQQGITALAAPQGLDHEHEQAIQQVHALQPQALQMVDEAIQVLSQGWSQMSPEEQEQFLRYYDPSDTGTVDEEFLGAVLNNYQKIRRVLAVDLTIVHEANSSHCEMMTLFYTDFFKVHTCPYILEEDNHQRIARDLVHEVAHMAWLVFDRSYYYPNYSSYTKLTPYGHWSAQIPLIGPILREALRSDTLYNPDTYSKYAAELVNPQQDNPKQVESRNESDLISSSTNPADEKLLSLTQTVETTNEVLAVDSKLSNLTNSN